MNYIPPFPAHLADEDHWGANFDVQDASMRTAKIVNGAILFDFYRWKHFQVSGEPLWAEFHEAFEGWTSEIFTKASRTILKELYVYLKEQGVWIRRPEGSPISFAKTLAQLVEEREPHQWTNEDLSAWQGEKAALQSQGYIPIWRYAAQDRDITSVQTLLNQPSPSPFQSPITVQMPFRGAPPADTNRTPPPTNPPSRAISDLIEVYASDNKKYTGEKDDLLDDKLRIFYYYCSLVGLNEDQYALVFPLMLTGRASTYYHRRIAHQSHDFPTITNMIRDHFETEERRQEYLTQWYKTTLPLVMSRNPRKTQLECLELLFDRLEISQRALFADRRGGESRLRDQIMYACKGVPECGLALIRPSDSVEGLCADLRSAVQLANENPWG